MGSQTERLRRRETSLPRRQLLMAAGGTGAVTLAGCFGLEELGDDDGAFFDVSEITPTETTASQGESINVSATITNTGDTSATQTIECDIDGTVVADEELTLAEGESETVHFDEISTSDLGIETHTYRIASDDDEKTGELTVQIEEVSVLVFSATDETRRESIETGNEAIEALASDIADEVSANEVTIDVIEADTSEFPSSHDTLQEYDTVVWNNTTGAVLNEEQRMAFQWYIQGGGGFAGIHAAAETHHDWTWYGELIGAYAENAPDVQPADVQVTDRSHPSTSDLPARWEVEDEWYDFDQNPRGDVHVLASVDERTYDGAAMDGGLADHPISWCHEFDGGRAWYTARGHTEDAFEETHFLEHLKGGILWSAGVLDGGATGTVWDQFTVESITDNTGEPMKLDVGPDGRLFHSSRQGELFITDQESGETTTALVLDVYTGEEDGVQGISLDPNFEENGWIWVFYSPAETPGSPYEYSPYEVERASQYQNLPYCRLSRFDVDGETIDPDSEVEVLRVEMQRESCCHVAGDIVFDSEGYLYLSIGDDTNPFESDGYAPIDEREGNEYIDAQRTSGNTNDLRGSILRIRPEDDGSYSIPEDNLFPEAEYEEAIAERLVRPEIYVLGLRNPFTMAIDPETDDLVFGDYGEGAGGWSDERGALGLVQFYRTSEPIYAGWPYFAGPNYPYTDWNFETEEVAGVFDPEQPINDSPNNDGLTELPPATKATHWYPMTWNSYTGGGEPDYIELEAGPDTIPHPGIPGGSGGPMTGPIYRHDEEFADTALPEYYDGKHLIMDYHDNWTLIATYDEDDEPLTVHEFLPEQLLLESPFYATIGPEGHLYVMEYGAGASSPQIYRVYHEE
ncbi:ThuA domain-containing protein [Halobacteria archaeon AArc-dxtr1]|nr:ThuA domain-containing protein [Halobacteria archaeon AArc-dxtr1]